MINNQTNRVFYIKNSFNNKNKDRLEVFIPTYVGIKFKNISEINIGNANAQMVATVNITFCYENLMPAIIQIIRQKIQINFNGQEHVQLYDQERNIKCSNNQQKSLLTYTLRDAFPLSMSSKHVSWVPYDILDLSVIIAIKNIEVDLYDIQYTQMEHQLKQSQKFKELEDFRYLKQRQRRIFIKFNCMDTNNRKLKFTESQSQNFGQFRLARQLMNVKYVNYESQSMQTQFLQNQLQMPAEQKLKKIKPYRYARFQVSIYRLPTSTLFTVFFPLYLLSILNLAIQFTSHDLKDRVGNSATLLLAYTAFLPTVRESIPPTPKATLIDAIVYSLLANTLICLINSFFQKDYTAKQSQADHQSWYKDPILITMMGILIIGFFVIFFIHVTFKLLWQPNYTAKSDISGASNKFDSKQWGNEQCDQYFKNLKPHIRYEYD